MTTLLVPKAQVGTCIYFECSRLKLLTDKYDALRTNRKSH